MNLNIENSNVTLSQSESELRSGNIPKLFRKFAIPGVVGMLFLGLQTIIDGVVLGNYVGSNALASVSLVLPCYSLMAAVSIILGVGSQTLVSINLGRLNRQGANDAIVSGGLFVAMFAIFAGIAIYLFAPEIAYVLGANDVLVAGAVDYMRALSPFFPILVVMFFCDYTLKALGKPIYAMVVMTTTVFVNIVLDIIFVAFCDMQTSGAGLATGLAFTVGALMSLPIVLSQREKVNVFKGKFNIRLVGQMFYNGSSEGVAELSSGISILLFNVTMMRYLGEDGVAAFTALSYILFVCITVFIGISDGIIPIISYNFGAKNSQRISAVLKLALKTNFVIGLSIFILLVLFGRHFVQLFFTSESTAVVDIAANGTYIYAFAFLCNGLNILASSYFTAMANAKISIIISLLRGILLIAPLVYVLPLLLGVEGVWLAVPLAELGTLIVSYFLVRKSIATIKSQF